MLLFGQSERFQNKELDFGLFRKYLPKIMCNMQISLVFYSELNVPIFWGSENIRIQKLFNSSVQKLTATNFDCFFCSCIHLLSQSSTTLKQRMPQGFYWNPNVRIVGGQSGQSFGHLVKLKMRVDVVEKYK